MSQYRSRNAPIINPFDQLSATAFDSFVANVSSTIRNALNPAEDSPKPPLAAVRFPGFGTPATERTASDDATISIKANGLEESDEASPFDSPHHEVIEIQDDSDDAGFENNDFSLQGEVIDGTEEFNSVEDAASLEEQEEEDDDLDPDDTFIGRTVSKGKARAPDEGPGAQALQGISERIQSHPELFLPAPLSSEEEEEGDEDEVGSYDDEEDEPERKGEEEEGEEYDSEPSSDDLLRMRYESQGREGEAYSPSWSQLDDGPQSADGGTGDEEEQDGPGTRPEDPIELTDSEDEAGDDPKSRQQDSSSSAEESDAGPYESNIEGEEGHGETDVASVDHHQEASALTPKANKTDPPAPIPVRGRLITDYDDVDGTSEIDDEPEQDEYLPPSRMQDWTGDGALRESVEPRFAPMNLEEASDDTQDEMPSIEFENDLALVASVLEADRQSAILRAAAEQFGHPAFDSLNPGMNPGIFPGPTSIPTGPSLLGEAQLTSMLPSANPISYHKDVLIDSASLFSIASNSLPGHSGDMGLPIPPLSQPRAAEDSEISTFDMFQSPPETEHPEPVRSLTPEIDMFNLHQMEQLHEPLVDPLYVTPSDDDLNIPSGDDEDDTSLVQHQFDHYELSILPDAHLPPPPTNFVNPDIPTPFTSAAPRAPDSPVSESVLVEPPSTRGVTPTLSAHNLNALVLATSISPQHDSPESVSSHIVLAPDDFENKQDVDGAKAPSLNPESPSAVPSKSPLHDVAPVPLPDPSKPPAPAEIPIPPIPSYLTSVELQSEGSGHLSTAAQPSSTRAVSPDALRSHGLDGTLAEETSEEPNQVTDRVNSSAAYLLATENMTVNEKISRSEAEDEGAQVAQVTPAVSGLNGDSNGLGREMTHSGSETMEVEYSFGNERHRGGALGESLSPAKDVEGLTEKEHPASKPPVDEGDQDYKRAPSVTDALGDSTLRPPSRSSTPLAVEDVSASENVASTSSRKSISEGGSSGTGRKRKRTNVPVQESSPALNTRSHQKLGSDSSRPPSPSAASIGAQSSDGERRFAVSRGIDTGKGPRRQRTGSFASSVASNTSQGSPTRNLSRARPVVVVPPMHFHHHGGGPINVRRSPSANTPSTTPLVTRSQCRFHKISAPGLTPGTVVHFIVPGCSLNAADAMAEEDIVDCGIATDEDNMNKITDVSGLDAKLASVLRKLVGPDLMHEGVCGYLPALIPESIPDTPRATRPPPAESPMPQGHPGERLGSSATDDEHETSSAERSTPPLLSRTTRRKPKRGRKSNPNSDIADYRPPDDSGLELDETSSSPRKRQKRLLERATSAVTPKGKSHISHDIISAASNPPQDAETKAGHDALPLPESTSEAEAFESSSVHPSSSAPRLKKRARDSGALLYKPATGESNDDSSDSDSETFPRPRAKRQRRANGKSITKIDLADLGAPSPEHDPSTIPPQPDNVSLPAKAEEPDKDAVDAVSNKDQTSAAASSEEKPLAGLWRWLSGSK